MILFFGIDVPDRLFVKASADYGACRIHCGQHRVIHVVVAVLTVSAHAEHIFISVKIFPYSIHGENNGFVQT